MLFECKCGYKTDIEQERDQHTKKCFLCRKERVFNDDAWPVQEYGSSQSSDSPSSLDFGASFSSDSDSFGSFDGGGGDFDGGGASDDF